MAELFFYMNDDGTVCMNDDNTVPLLNQDDFEDCFCLNCECQGTDCAGCSGQTPASFTVLLDSVSNISDGCYDLSQDASNPCLWEYEAGSNYIWMLIQPSGCGELVVEVSGTEEFRQFVNMNSTENDCCTVVEDTGCEAPDSCPCGTWPGDDPNGFPCGGLLYSYNIEMTVEYSTDGGSTVSCSETLSDHVEATSGSCYWQIDVFETGSCYDYYVDVELDSDRYWYITLGTSGGAGINQDSRKNTGQTPAGYYLNTGWVQIGSGLHCRIVNAVIEEGT